jgi:hypothetical protein
MQSFDMYVNEPAFALAQPTPTAIVLAAVTASSGGLKRHYSARTLAIPAPTEPTWYYVTIDDDDIPTCQTADTLCGELGNVYVGAILATQSGGKTSVLAGGWPAPVSFQVAS